MFTCLILCLSMFIRASKNGSAKTVVVEAVVIKVIRKNSPGKSALAEKGPCSKDKPVVLCYTHT